MFIDSFPSWHAFVLTYRHVPRTRLVSVLARLKEVASLSNQADAMSYFCFLLVWPPYLCHVAIIMGSLHFAMP